MQNEYKKNKTIKNTKRMYKVLRRMGTGTSPHSKKSVPIISHFWDLENTISSK